MPPIVSGLRVLLLFLGISFCYSQFMTTDEKFMQLAIQEALKAKTEGEFPFGSVIIRNGEVIAQNHSREATLKNVTAHSELQTVSEACVALGRTDLSGCTMYCSAEPCTMCASAMLQARITRFVIGAQRNDLSNIMRPRKIGIEALISDSSYQPELTVGVLRKEALDVFSGVERNNIASQAKRLR